MFRVPFLANVAANRSVGCTTEFVNIGRNVVGLNLTGDYSPDSYFTCTVMPTHTLIHMYSRTHSRTHISTHTIFIVIGIIAIHTWTWTDSNSHHG